MKKPSIQTVFVKFSVASCLVVAITSIIFYMIYSEVAIKEFLIDKRINGIPIFLVIIAVSLVMGLIVGNIVGFYIKRPFREFSNALIELGHGNHSVKVEDAPFKEFQELEVKFQELSNRYSEQASSFQQNTSERVLNEEERLENAISQERSRLARELHDSVSQQLFAISMLGSAVNEVIDKHHPVKKQIEMIELASVQAQSEMRALLLHLRPVQLDGKHLAEGINELLKDLHAKQQISIIWHTDDIQLSKGVEDHLFRILQEALSNSLRHAKAKHLEVRLRKIEPFAILKIIDDGIGFDTKQSKAGSYGLQSMRERVTEIGGTLKIISVPEKGSTIEVKVPLIAETILTKNDHEE